MQDPFMIPKLMFFSFVYGLAEPYLKIFQSNRPVVPYIYSEVTSVIKSLLSLSTYRKDFSWLHFDNETRVQEWQQVKDQQSYIFVFVAYQTVPSST